MIDIILFSHLIIAVLVVVVQIKELISAALLLFLALSPAVGPLIIMALLSVAHADERRSRR